MAEKSYSNIFPPQMQILSGSALKLIAIITMFIDHTASIILSRIPAAQVALFRLGDTDYSWYRICRDIGRSAFPIFCFLLVEGFIHTRNRFRYGFNLLIFAVISEIPWNIWHSTADSLQDAIIYPDKQNVFFTLLLGYLGFCAAEYFWENKTLQFLSLMLLFAASYFLKADYGWRGYVFLLIMYFLRNEKASQAIVGSCWLFYEWKACFAFIPINMYNGKRGFIKGNFAKYFFYLFYPAHATILLLIRHFVLKL